MKKQHQENLLQTLKARFEQNPHRHPGIPWADVQARLEGNLNVLKSLQAMEATGGEPDVIGLDPKTGVVTFCDCAKESPTGRRSLCYDRAALDARKENKPTGSAVEMAEAMGIALLTEDQYRALQELGEFDAKTSSWLATPLSFAPSAGRFSVTFVMAGCSFTTMACSRITRREGFAGCCGFEPSKTPLTPWRGSKLPRHGDSVRSKEMRQKPLTQKPKPHPPWPQPSH